MKNKNASYDKKCNSLGMNPGTAQNRLRRDLLFYFVTKEGINCYHCKLPMDRDNFSVEHIIPWLYAENALELFFDLSNVTFAHLKCNVENRRVPHKLSDEELVSREKIRQAEYEKKRKYCPIKRRQKYIEKGI